MKKINLTPFNILILTSEDIETENKEWMGQGYDLIILPAKYKGFKTPYLEQIITPVIVRKGGEVVYI